jgi:hypothetical protein
MPDIARPNAAGNSPIDHTKRLRDFFSPGIPSRNEVVLIQKTERKARGDRMWERYERLLTE